MFDLKELSKDMAGYELRIKYITHSGMYTVTGHHILASNTSYSYSQDGMMLHFGTMEEVLKYISEYK